MNWFYIVGVEMVVVYLAQWTTDQFHAPGFVMVVVVLVVGWAVTHYFGLVEKKAKEWEKRARQNHEQ